MSLELQKSFPKSLALLTVAVIALLVIASQLGWLHSSLGFSLATPLFFGGFSYFFHKKLMKAEAERYQKLINTYLGGSMVRLLLGAALLFISIKAYPQIPIMELGAIFVVVYILYIFFEAIFLSAQLRTK
jgi:hypothetical protein